MGGEFLRRNLLKYHQAAFSYLGIGVVIVVLTIVFIPEAHYRSGIFPLLAGIAVLLALTYFLYRGVRWLALTLCVLAAARSCWWIYSFIAFAEEETRWVYIMNALLNMIVVYMLARAAAEKTEPAL
jgi:uncharacterized membrane protein